MAYVNLEQPGFNDTTNTMQPTFGFNYSIVDLDTNVGVQVASDPLMAVIVLNSSSIFHAIEWRGIEIAPNKSIAFVFPDTKLLPDGVYYWRAWKWDSGAGVYRYSEVRKITVLDSVYRWRFVKGAVTEYLKPAKGGILTSTEIVGCQKVEKHVFKITLHPMLEARVTALKYFFDLNTPFYFYDNKGISYLCYWGDCDRNIQGNAFQPKNREFGIVLTNSKYGMLRWNGTIILTEV